MDTKENLQGILILQNKRRRRKGQCGANQMLWAAPTAVNGTNPQGPLFIWERETQQIRGMLNADICLRGGKSAVIAA